MRNAAMHADAVQTLIAALESGVCDEAAAKELFALGAEAVTLALLAVAGRTAEQGARLVEWNARIAEQNREAAAREARIAELQESIAAGANAADV